MWFKNLSMLRLPDAFTLPAEPFEAALADHPLRSPGPLELELRRLFARLDEILRFVD